MKKFLKITLRIVLGLIVFIALYLLAAFGLSKIATPAEPVADRTIDIYILTNGVHTDIVVPLKTEEIDWSKEVKFENTISKDTTAKLVAFGAGIYTNG
jgi:multisubunit Na+/H+ antiporter MnhC subunit